MKTSKQKKVEKQDEDIDAILKELNITPTVSSIAGAASGNERPLLSVSLRHLKAAEELRRLFGREVVTGRGTEDESGGDVYAGASRRIRRLAARGLLVRHQLRPGIIITPHEDWPKLNSSFIQMQAVGTASDGRPIFRYVFSPGYDSIQEAYEECQATFDPNAIAHLLQGHPYHLDALLTMSDLYRSMGEHAPADDCLERCIYALEMAWPPAFISAATVGSGARLMYDERSRPLFLSLFRYVALLGRRGLHRTALEVSKLLLALDDDDPMGALFVLDYYAMRSGQHAFLRRFVNQYGGGDGSTALLPNMAYSLALSSWYEEQGSRGSGKDGDKARSRREREASGNGADGPALEISSSDVLAKAILLHPLVVVRLQTKLKDKGVGTGSVWATSLSSPPFSATLQGGNVGLSHLVDIFVERQHLMWKSGPVQDWLLEAVQRVVAATKSGDASMLPNGVSAAGWAAVRDQAFPPTDPTNPYQHLRLHEFSESTMHLPAEEVHGLGGVPIPDGVDGQGVEALQAEVARLRAEGVEHLNATHPLMALLRSLLPWVADGEQPDYAADGE